MPFFFKQDVTRQSHIIYPPTPPPHPLHLPELMAHKQLIIRTDLDYNVRPLDQQQQLWNICSESAAFGLTWCQTLLWRSDALHTRWEKTKLSVQERSRVWLKRLTRTPRPTHLFHPVATLEFLSFLSWHFFFFFLLVWQPLSTTTDWTQEVASGAEEVSAVFSLIVSLCSATALTWGLQGHSDICVSFHSDISKNTKETPTHTLWEPNKPALLRGLMTSQTKGWELWNQLNLPVFNATCWITTYWVIASWLTCENSYKTQQASRKLSTWEFQQSHLLESPAVTLTPAGRGATLGYIWGQVQSVPERSECTAFHFQQQGKTVGRSLPGGYQSYFTSFTHFVL